MSRDVSEYAKFDPAFITDGLFVPRANRNKAVNIKRTWDQGEIGFRGVQLGAMHQSVLLAICARTGRNGLLIEGSSSDLMAQQLWLELATNKDTADQPRSLVRASAYSILTDAGIDTSEKGYDQLINALRDLTTLSIFRSVGKVGGASNLLSFSNNEEKLAVSLNWRLAGAIFGNQNIQVSLHERLKLSSPQARILHAWLSAHVRKHGSLMAGKGASLDALLPHVWGDSKASKQTQSNRRAKLKNAIAEIDELDTWELLMDGKRVYVSRPKSLDPLTYIRGMYEEGTTPGEMAYRKLEREKSKCRG